MLTKLVGLFAALLLAANALSSCLTPHAFLVAALYTEVKSLKMTLPDHKIPIREYCEG